MGAAQLDAGAGIPPQARACYAHRGYVARPPHVPTAAAAPTSGIRPLRPPWGIHNIMGGRFARAQTSTPSVSIGPTRTHPPAYPGSAALEGSEIEEEIL